MNREVAIVVVDKKWINTAGIRHILNRGRQSKSESETHIVVAPLHDRSDPHGLWLSRIVTNTGEEVRFMIPWSVVIGLAIAIESDAAGERMQIGFAGAGVSTFAAADVVEGTEDKE